MFHVPPHFIGRDALVQYINSWLQDGSHGAAIALLYGIGGVGKTAIAVKIRPTWPTCPLATPTCWLSIAWMLAYK